MKKINKIEIPKPCQKQAWSTNHISDNEKLCLLCSEKVYDASNLTDRELYNLVNSENKPKCLQVKTSQLNRELNVTRNIKKILCSLLISSLLTSCAQIKESKSSNNNKTQHANINIKSKYITGTIIDKKTQEPIKNAIVSILDREKQVKTNSKGNFKINLPKNNLIDTIDLEIRTKKGIRYYDNFEITKDEFINKIYELEEQKRQILVGRFF